MHEEVARRLGGPGAGGVGGDAAVEDFAVGDVDEEQQLVAAQQGGVDGYEVAGNGVSVPIIRSWALTRGFALRPGTRNRCEIRYTRTQHRPAARQVNDHGRVSAAAGSASWCRPDQKPVRPGGVTHHSVVAAGPFRCAHDTDKGDASCWQTSWIM